MEIDEIREDDQHGLNNLDSKNIMLIPKFSLFNIFSTIISLLVVILIYYLLYTNYTQIWDFIKNILFSVSLLSQILISLLLIVISIAIVTSLVIIPLENLYQLWSLLQPKPKIIIHSDGIKIADKEYKWSQINGYNKIDNTIILNFKDYRIREIIKLKITEYKLSNYQNQELGNRNLLELAIEKIDLHLYQQ